MDIPDLRIFSWLEKEGAINGARYLVFLNLRWSGEGEAFDIEMLKSASLRLRAEPQYWRELLLTPSWRHTLVGTCALMLLVERGFASDLEAGILSGNMVAPQMLVAFGLLHPEKSLRFASKAAALVDDIGFKAVGAADILLAELTGAPIPFVEKTAVDVESSERLLGRKIFASHWSYWRRFVHC